MKITGVIAAAVALASVFGAEARPLQKSNVQKGKWFDRFVFIIFENAGYNQVIVDPNFAALTNRPDAKLLTNFYAVAKPSLPNYYATIAGSTFGVNDDFEHNFDALTIVDLLESKGISWKAYAENYPKVPKGTCYLGATDVYSNGTAVPSSYRRIDNPFVAFLNIQNNPNRCDKVVPATEFEKDFENGDLPQYIYYIPNLKNNAHDTTVAYGGKYLKNYWGKYLNDQQFMKDTAVLVTFDEDEDTEKNHIFAALLGGSVKPEPGHPKNTTDHTPYTLYSFPKTIEENWGLGSLGQNETYAPVLKF
jgi:acid phosphatase